MSNYVLFPSPLAGEGGEDQWSEPGEGASIMHCVCGSPPHPPRFADARSEPSPARGEGS
jgi:hypothetical protein